MDRSPHCLACGRPFRRSAREARPKFPGVMNAGAD